MSVRYALQELVGQANTRAGDFGFQAAQAARSLFCRTYGQYPGAFIPNPADSFVRGALSGLCSDFPPPAAPVVPFTGGQCPCASYRVTFTRTLVSGGTVTPTTLPLPGPILGIFQRQAGQQTELFIRHGVCSGGVQTGTTELTVSGTGPVASFGIVSVQPQGAAPNNCGNPLPRFPNTRVPTPERTEQTPITVEGDRNIIIPISIAPIFEEDVCIGTYAFCVDIGDVRATLDVGGITLQLPGTGGGDSGSGGSSGDSQTINNIDNRTTIIQENQEQCCDAIIQAISSFRNRATEEFNDAEQRDACIVGLIRNAAEKIPRLEESSDTIAIGITGVLGDSFTVQPARADSCFLVLEIEPLPVFQGKKYKITENEQDREASYGHGEIVLLDGTASPPSEAGIKQVYRGKTFFWFPYISSGNAVRLSLAGGLSYRVTDPGFRWRPSALPTCEEVVEPLP